MEKDAANVKDSIIRMAWYMRGGATLAELMESSMSDRELINKLIKENLETTKKSGMAFF